MDVHANQRLHYFHIHYTTPVWELKSRVLAKVQLTSQHSGTNIASELDKLANELGIKDKIVSIVTDNAPDMIAAARIFGWTHFSCFAHTLNLVGTSAMKADDNLARVQQMAKNVVSFSITALTLLIAIVNFRSKYQYQLISSYRMSPLAGILLIVCSKDSSSKLNLSLQSFVS